MFEILGKTLAVSTLKSFIGGGTAAFVLLNKFPLIEGAGGGGGGGLGPPSKKSSVEGKLGGSPPGPNKLFPPPGPKVGGSLPPEPELLSPKVFLPRSLSSFFLFQILFQVDLVKI